MRHREQAGWESGAPPLRRLTTSVPGPERGALLLPGWVDGCDLSEFQGRVDYAALRNAGFHFGVVRASLGPGYVDRAAARHLSGLRAAGLRAMCYGAAQPEKGDPRGQARRALEGMGDTYTRLFLDLETRGGKTNAQLVDFALGWLDEVGSFGALAGGFYSYEWYESTLQPELSLSPLSDHPLWQAYIPAAKEPWAPAWGDAPRVPAPWARADVWQYGGDGGYAVPGVPGACDRDLFRGSLDDLDRFMGLPVAPVDSAADTQPAGALDVGELVFDPFEDETPTKK